jgi:hypothetical protein
MKTETIKPWPRAPTTEIPRTIEKQLDGNNDLFPKYPECEINVERMMSLAQGHPNKEWLESIHDMLTIA